MNNILFWFLVVFLSPFVVYVIFRIVSSAVFRSFFEQKKEFEKKNINKEDVHERKRT